MVKPTPIVRRTGDFPEAISFSSTFYPRFPPVAADLDGDGDLDLVMTAGLRSRVVVIENLTGPASLDQDHDVLHQPPGSEPSERGSNGQDRHSAKGSWFALATSQR